MKDKKAKPHALTTGGSKRSTKDRKVTKTLLSSDISPEVVGNYRIIQKLGVGGMGEVYEAEQIKPIRRKVALKLIKWGMDTKQVVARFESERQALALMNHSNIAKVFDAGTTEKGRPYFIMECVKGIPITEYCDKMRLDNRKRLELFTQVCDGVQHAHQKGIIHRDIKGSNVLVMIQDEKPVPKIIDFGVAKATAQRLTERTVFTEMGQLIGTPEYMSPEQAEMTGLDIDTRTDVYSLGVLLYELLVGVLPFDAKELRGAGFDEIRRKVREDEPPKPSTRLTTPGFDTTRATRNRKTDLSTLTKQLKGELDWIAMKAMAKDRTQRYASVSELAADIGRHLRHEVVLAGPPSAVYRMRKYVRRHKAGVVAAALVILAVIIGITGTSIGLIKARRAEKVAKEEADTAQQVSNFLVELFEVSDPSEARGNTITAREILDRGAEKVDRELESQPLVQARLMNTMGEVYRKLGLYDQAESLVKKAISIQQDTLGDEHLEMSRSLNILASILWERGDYAEAKPIYERTLKIRKKILGPDHLDVAHTLNNLANLLMFQGNYAEAKPLMERALEIREKAYGPNHEDVANTLNSMGALYYLMGEFAKAEPLFERTLAIREEILGHDHPHLAMTLNNLALVRKELGKYSGAKLLLERTIAIQEKVLGPDHTNLASGLHNLAEVLRAMGDYAAAKPLYERAIKIYENAHGPNHPELARFIRNLAELLKESGNLERALLLLERSLAIQEKALGPDHPDTAWSLFSLANVYSEQDRHTKAESFYRRSLKIFENAFGPDHGNTAWCLIGIAYLYSKQGRHAEAETLFKRALSAQEKAYGSEHPNLLKTLIGYAAVLQELGQKAEAKQLEARAETIRRKKTK